MMMKTNMDSRKSFQSLAQSIYSLMGFKNLTPTWADSVCNIIKTLPSEVQAVQAHEEDDPDQSKDGDMGITISIMQRDLAVLSAKIYHLNTQRRQVLNDLLDLKGNIRVFCRVRPIAVGEGFDRSKPVVATDSNGVLLNFAESKSKLYNFDKVFHPDSSQDDVFLEVEPIIKSALDGYNTCIFAYGQTGTGKTFTMEGTSDCPGVVPRAIDELFKQARDSNCTFIFSFSMLEIYMGHLRDLLSQRTKRATDPILPCLSIQTDLNGEIEIDNLVSIPVSDFNQAIRLYRLGCRFRSTASTNSNTESSRSHCMIRISLTCSDAIERRRVANKIWMVDLGGSERVLKTRAFGRRLDEGKAINLSLSALADVINALQTKRRHIPYRNSKLTQVLKDSLGEDSKTLMLVHVSPKEEDLCETVCSLSFATRVRGICLGNELSTEAMAQREVAMTNLQQMIEQIEDQRNEFTREIKKINENIEKLTRMSASSNQQEEASHKFAAIPQSNAEIGKKTAHDKAASSSKVPSFMRPTVCSRRKSGTNPVVLRNICLNPARKNPSSYCAESVTFPRKVMSECNSESSISRASCIVDLNRKQNADNQTECSRSTSECDTEMGGLLEQNRSWRSSTYQMAHHNLSKNNRDRKTNKRISPKFLKVDTWLHSHKNATTITSYAPRNKRVLSIPTPEKKNRDNRQRIVEKLHEGELCDYEVRKKKHNNKDIKKMVDAGIAGGSVSEMETCKKPIVLMDFTTQESCLTSISSSATSDSMLIVQAQGLAHDLSNESNEFSNSTSPGTWCERSDGQEEDMPVEVETYRKQGSEFLSSKKSLTSSFTTSDGPNNIICPREDFSVSISKADCENVPKELGKNNEEEELHVTAQNTDAGVIPFPYKLISQRGLPTEKSNPEILTTLFPESAGVTQNLGMCDLLRKKIQVLYNIALLGLGLQTLGFGNDFFYALAL